MTVRFPNGSFRDVQTVRGLAAASDGSIQFADGSTEAASSLDEGFHWIAAIAAALTAGTPYLELHSDVAATVVSLNPNTGSHLGGTETFVTGTGFRPGGTVFFGGVVALQTTYLSSTTLNVLTPPGTAGAVDVSYRDSRQIGTPAAGAFTYS